LPYELYADGNTDAAKKIFSIKLKADNKFFKDAANGSPFLVHARNYLNNDFAEKNYALIAGDELSDAWNIRDFKNNNYHLEIFAPNGFYRKFTGSDDDPKVDVYLNYHTDLKNNLTGNIQFIFKNSGNKNHTIEIKDNAYGLATKTFELNKNEKTMVLYLDKNYGWYDFSIKIKGIDTFEKRYAGHVETGSESKSDPLMGMMV
jgi:phospholipase C